jgi:hypothetical protein
MDGRNQKKWVLSCGRFAPSEGVSVEARVRAMESYVARLAEEMEFLIAELGREVAAVSTAVSAAVSAAGSAAAETENEEG